MHQPDVPHRADLAIAARERLHDLLHVWEKLSREIRRRLHAHRRALKILIRLAVGISVVATTLLVIAWNATPSTADLANWVRAQDAREHVPYTPFSAITPIMAHALVAIEDERFYQHHGIDTIGLLRAAWDDLRAGRLVEGGSTLTGQLAKNAYLQGNDRSVGRKLEDLLLAVKIERRYSKSQILEMYLNLVYFGDGAYGIGAATMRYFGILPSQLDLAQAALLAGLVQAPSAYDPYCHMRIARMRQEAVLARMVADGYITAAQGRAAGQKTLTLRLTFTASTPDAYC